MNLIDLLRLPEAKEADFLDSPEMAVVHKRIISKKAFLRQLYRDFYGEIRSRLPAQWTPGKVIEIGSGAGFIKDVISGVVTSDVFVGDGIDQVFSAEKMPFADGSVDAFVMLNVFHHLPDAKKCLEEMSRCLRPGGRIIMIEPANTPWSKFIAEHFHHEPFDSKAGWTLEGEGRLSAGNWALPWIVFIRDRKILQEFLPELVVQKIELTAPFRYLVSGGLSFRSFLPPWSYPLVGGLEWLLTLLFPLLAIFQIIQIEKKEISTCV